MPVAPVSRNYTRTTLRTSRNSELECAGLQRFSGAFFSEPDMEVPGNVPVPVNTTGSARRGPATVVQVVGWHRSSRHGRVVMLRLEGNKQRWEQYGRQLGIVTPSPARKRFAMGGWQSDEYPVNNMYRDFKSNYTFGRGTLFMDPTKRRFGNLHRTAMPTSAVPKRTTVEGSGTAVTARL